MVLARQAKTGWFWNNASMIKKKLAHFICTFFQNHGPVKQKRKPTKYRDFFYLTQEQVHNRNRKKSIVTTDVNIIIHHLFILPASKHWKQETTWDTWTGKLWCVLEVKRQRTSLMGTRKGTRWYPAAGTHTCYVQWWAALSHAGPELITSCLLSACVFSRKRQLHSPH